MKIYVEFYFPGLSVSGQCEREVSSRNVEEISRIPEYAISFRFFNKDKVGNKVNYSPYHFIGKIYSPAEFKAKFPQLSLSEITTCGKRIVKTTTGGFYPIEAEDIVVLS